MVQFGQPLLSCSKQVALSAAEAIDTLDGIVTGPPAAAIIRTAAMAWCRNTSPPFGYEFDEASVVIADGVNVVRPRDRTALQPGRWRLFSTGSGPCCDVALTFYVDPQTMGALALQNGSECCPFATVEQAFARITALGAEGAQVRILAGELNEAVVWPDLDRISVLGAGSGSTIWRAPGGSPVISWSPGAAEGSDIHRAMLRGVTFDCVTSQLALDIVGQTADPDTFLDEGFFLSDVQALAVQNHGDIMHFELVGHVEFDALCRIGCEQRFVQTGARVRMRNVGTYLVTGGSQLPLLQDDFSGANPIPGVGRGDHTVDDGLINEGVLANGQVRFIALRSSYIVASASSAGIVCAMIALAGFPQIVQCNGTCIGNVIVPFPNLDVAVGVVNLEEGYFGDVTVSVAAGGTRGIVYGANGFFNGTITAGNMVDIDIRNAYYLQGNLASAGNGAIDRTSHQLLAMVTPTGVSAIPITPPFPTAAGGNYFVGWTSTVTIAVNAGVAAKTPAGFNFTITFPGDTVDLQILRQP